MRVEDDPHHPAESPSGTTAHASWAPPGYHTASGERRAGTESAEPGSEPPGPVAVSDESSPYDGPSPAGEAPATGGQGTETEQAALDDVDGGEFPPDEYLSRQQSAEA